MGEFSALLQRWRGGVGGWRLGQGRAFKGAEVHGTLGQLPVTSFLFLLHSPGSCIDLSSKLLGHGVAEETGNHPRDQAAWASLSLVTVSGTAVLESCRPPPPGVGSSVGCGELPRRAGRLDGCFLGVAASGGAEEA